MPDFIKDNWFVLVIAVLILCGVVYFIMDTTKDNISAKHQDGKDVVATLENKAITADDLYHEATPFDAPLLYNMYKNAVIEESVKTTKEMKKEAKNMENAIESNIKAQDSENYKIAIDTELAIYGFNGYEELNDYCLMNVKQKEMNKKFIEEHFDEYKGPVESLSPRTISIIKVDVENPAEISEAEQKKMDSIDKSISEDSFAKAATAFSEDVMTSKDDGFFGYICSTDSMQTTGLNDSVLQQAFTLEKGETSSWIQTVDPNTSLSSYYKVHVDETDLETIFKSDKPMVKDRLVSSFIDTNANLEMDVIEAAAKKLDIQFHDEKVEKKIKNYIASMKGEATK